MNTYLLIAAVLTIVLGLAHSVIGEVLIFRHWRKGEHKEKIHGAIPMRHRRIIWASWHIGTIFGFGLAALLYWLASPYSQDLNTDLLEKSVLFPMLASALLVLVGTRGKHPGWIVMLIISVLIWLS